MNINFEIYMPYAEVTKAREKPLYSESRQLVYLIDYKI